MKNFSIALFILLSLCIYHEGQSQTVTEEWVARYNGPPGIGNDWATAMAIDGSDNVYVTGYSDGSGTGFDYATIKYDTDGVEQWVARYNGPENNDDFARAIALDGSGNVYVTGYSKGSGSGYDYATIKYNTDGVEQWVARYNSPGNGINHARAITVDDAGNVYVTGGSEGSGTGRDYATIKYNTDGVEQWVARYNGPGNSSDEAFAIALDGSGNVYVTGYSEGSGTDRDYATIKYNTDGVEQWVARYNGLGNFSDAATAITIDGSNNVYVTGGSWGSGTGIDYATIKYNTNGVEQWVARYYGPGSWDLASAIALDGSGNVYVTGYSDGNGIGGDYATIKYNTNGVEQWVARYNGPGNGRDEATAIAVDGSGNVYVTGYSERSEIIYSDYATIKYNTNGVEQWVARYNGLGNGMNRANAIALDGSGNVYVTGPSEGIAAAYDYDYATIKYSKTISIQNVSAEIPERFSLFQNYPNPFNPTTNIRFDIQKQGLITLKVYDILGKEVKTLVNESLNPGTYNYQLTIDNYQLTSGVYFYRLEADGFSDVKRMVLLK